MVQTRERCKRVGKQIYWTEFAPNRHQFLRIMIGGFRNQLRIPRKFVSHFKEKLQGTVKLIGPSRNVWNVKIARTADDVLFQIGREKFAQDHSLAESDFVVFQYIGYSSFNVSIFDETGCEREGAFFVKKHIWCTRNACFLPNEDKKIVQVSDLEEMRANVQIGKLEGRDADVGKEVRERNLKSKSGHKTSMLVGTSFEDNNSNIETIGARQEVVLYMNRDKAKRRSSNKKQMKCEEEDERDKSAQGIQIKPTYFCKEMKIIRKNQNTTHDVSKQFCSTEESASPRMKKLMVMAQKTSGQN